MESVELAGNHRSIYAVLVCRDCSYCSSDSSQQESIQRIGRRHKQIHWQIILTVF